MAVATKKKAASGRSRPAVLPGALQTAAAFPALEAIFTRRARRFALGATITGPLAYSSTKDPVPLAYEEEAILVAAATGVTGVVREEWPFTTAEGGPTGADKLQTYTGRPFPSPLAIHGTELFWTNDEGTYVLPQRDERPERYVQNQTPEEQHDLYRRAIKLQDSRLDVPRRRPNLFKFNEWIVNHEGTTLFMPIADVTRQCISAMLLYFDRPHGYYLKDMRLGADPLKPFMDSGLFSKHAHPYDIADFERWQMVDMNGVEAGLMVQNLMLTTQALGLGGHPFSGGKGRVTMGGEPLWEIAGGEGPCGSLGFTFHQVPDDGPAGPGELHSGRSSRRLRGGLPAVSREHGRGRRPHRRHPLGRSRESSRRRRPCRCRGDQPTSPGRCPDPRTRLSRPRRRCATTSGTPTAASRRPSTPS